MMVAFTSGAFANLKVQNFEVKRVNIQNALQLEVAPGPVSRELVISFAEAGSNSTVTITDLKGTALLSKSVEAGSNKISINVSKLETGSYFVVLSNGELRSSKLFTKQ